MSAFTSLRPSLGLARTAAQASRGFSSSASRSVARMIITGRLANEPELQSTASGQDIIKYTIGTSHGSRENRQTSWFRVASFLPEGSQRDFIMGLPKGTLVYLEGDASMRSYEDADGKRHSSLNIIQRSLEVLSRPRDTSENTNPTEGH
ncbi:hypothetical protein POX_a00352 [Penicillium oxalicum]|uniref:SsDNA binding protein n=1 Tax=Penicillium oxalicum (strain 114-2 / CGMCC 5302) TaxID=933388 RepID=S8A0M0_PENO1|nr:hypothetical protein POX_a00352 [Penicillium oxalicum]EPS34676.1 hypothetical protein PDE_09640 [Penicillium oxalicum 114-2]KAI2793768.1 hypothetical protein POX_a00352 [Penicillium oxalicum]